MVLKGPAGQLDIPSPKDIWQDLVAFLVPTVAGEGMLLAWRDATGTEGCAKHPAVHRAVPHSSGKSDPSGVRNLLQVYIIVSCCYCYSFYKIELILL